MASLNWRDPKIKTCVVTSSYCTFGPTNNRTPGLVELPGMVVESEPGGADSRIGIPRSRSLDSHNELENSSSRLGTPAA